MTVRWIHAADLHIDSPLAGLDAYRDAPTHLLRTATRDAFERLVDVAVRDAVSFVVLAGDVYDGSWKDYQTGIYFAKMMGRLRSAGITVYLVDGNHDAESEMGRRLELPDNVFRFPSDRADTFEIPDLKVALHGRSFKSAATFENLAASYPPPRDGWCNIGVLHTALEGNANHAHYAPCTRQELAAKGYQYFALGHVHEWSVERVGSTVIAYPGNLQGRHIHEAGAKGALSVTAVDGEVVSVERVHTDVIRWHASSISIEGCASLKDVLRRVSEELGSLQGRLEWTGPLAVRVQFVGQGTAHQALLSDIEQVRAEVMAIAAVAADDSIWIEKVKILSSGPDQSEALRNRHDAASELVLGLEDASKDAEFLASLEDELRSLGSKIERPAADLVDGLRMVRDGDVARLVREISPTVAAILEEKGVAR